MPAKINVIKTVDEAGRDQYTVSASNLPDLANLLGVTQQQFVVKEDDKLTRLRGLQEANRRANTPEAIRRRTNFNLFTGEPEC
jgi:hypothetical protein